MAYQAEISRDNPTFFLFVVDQSGSMEDLTETGRSKANFVADVLNKTIYTLVASCSKADGVRNYFDVGVLAYGGSEIKTGFGGVLADKIVHPINAISEHTLRVEERHKKIDDGAGGVVSLKTKFPIWFDPKNTGGTRMRAALTKTVETVADWCKNHSGSYPPTILHVTDGHPSDGNPEPIADRLKKLGTHDGSCLLFNLHVDVGEGNPLIFPNDERAIADRFGKALFRMSSLLPPHAVEAAAGKGHDVRPGARAFVFNAGIEDIADFFDIGTRPAVAADR
jgi:hypothetical protein